MYAKFKIKFSPAPVNFQGYKVGTTKSGIRIENDGHKASIYNTVASRLILPDSHQVIKERKAYHD
jgi:hypothetical protein